MSTPSVLSAGSRGLLTMTLHPQDEGSVRHIVGAQETLVDLNWTMSPHEALVHLRALGGWAQLPSRALANPVPCLLHAEVQVSVSEWERHRPTLRHTELAPRHPYPTPTPVVGNLFPREQVL